MGEVGAGACLATCGTKDRTYVIIATYYKINWRNITDHCSRRLTKMQMRWGNDAVFFVERTIWRCNLLD